MNSNAAAVEREVKSEKKAINVDMKYSIRAEDLTPRQWSMIKTFYHDGYMKMRTAIQTYGAARLTFGFDSAMKPVSEIISF